MKKFTINGVNYEFGSISDSSISDYQKSELMRILNLSDNAFRNSDAALLLSGFTSAATDNAKELVMAKVNASVELASMHIYLAILGLSAKEIVDIMTSPVAELIINKMSDDIFIDNYTKQIPSVISTLRKDNKNDIALTNELVNFQKIFEGAQEVKYLAKLLSVNQKTSAKIEEIHKFLTTFENVIFSREIDLFGDSLKVYKTYLATTNDVIKSKLNPEQYNDYLKKMTDIIRDRSEGRFTNKDDSYIMNVLRKASNIEVKVLNHSMKVETRNVSVLGGEFDYRYYIYPSNEEYRTITKQYYDLIKDTFNVFDVIDSVPHFKWMIKGLSNSHTLLSINSVKYNVSFNLLKDLVNTYGAKLDQVSDVMGNKGIRKKISDVNIRNVTTYVDSLLKNNWISTSKFTSFDFSIDDIKEFMKRADVNRIEFYSSDSASNSRDMKSSNFKTVITSDSTNEDFSINLQSMKGIANFKILMEKVLLKILHKEIPDSESLLKVRSLINSNNLKGYGIAPAFRATDRHIPAAAEKIDQLIKIFNDLDLNTSKDLQLGHNLQWRQLFYIYNLLFNNDKYGDKRLSTFLEDYMKSAGSAAADYINYSYKLDSGEIKPFDLKNFSTKTPDDSEVMSTKELKDAKESLAKDLFYYAYNNNGSLSYSSNSISAINPDFLLLYGLTESAQIRQEKTGWKELMILLSNNNFLIQIKCN